MKFSLLSDNYIDTTLDNGIIYNLSIDRTLDNIGGSTDKNAYFAKVLCNIPKNREEIFKRREILSDFSQTDGLFADIKSIFKRYDKLKSDWLELKSGSGFQNENKGSEVALEYCYSSLKVTSLFPKTIFSFFCSINEILSSYPIKSSTLCAIRDYCKETTQNKAFSRLCEIAGLFSYNKASDYNFSVLCEISDLAYLCDCEITKITEREEKKKNILQRFKAQKSDEDIIFSTDNAVSEDTEYILCEALNRIDRLLEQLTDKIYDTFYGISLELDFYESALTYCDFLKESGVDFCYPEITESSLSFTSLLDLYLLSLKNGRVFANDFSLDNSFGAIIKGKNNTGKTTFLRSMGSSVLFALAGMPIPCKEAKIPLYSAVFSHFSSAEEEFEKGDDSGRFESEVKAIAKIIDKLQKNSLILLNETFQTTSYDEASKGIEPVLEVFICEKCDFIFVSHLNELFEKETENILKLESNTNYKIIPSEAKKRQEQ